MEKADLDYFIAGQYFVPGGNGLVEAQMGGYHGTILQLRNEPLIPKSVLDVTHLQSPPA
ncbi:MAG: hypothetical protein IPH20_20250 [Bacteroidales bacterium]|nr:hypothetical protein [Bacteroidales bacterium]